MPSDDDVEEVDPDENEGEYEEPELPTTLKK
jgi:hypothetical protein